MSNREDVRARVLYVSATVTHERSGRELNGEGENGRRAGRKWNELREGRDAMVVLGIT